MRITGGWIAAVALCVGLAATTGTTASARPAPDGAGAGTAAVGRGDGPVAIGVTARGVSYVGYGTGDFLSRFDADGKRLRPIRLAAPGPITGIDVDSTSRVWVAQDDVLTGYDGVRVARTIAREPGSSCTQDEGLVREHGAVTLSSTRIFVADRCTPTLEVYERTTGRLVATARLAERAKGLVWQPASGGRPARLYVALPDRAVVQVFDAARLGTGARPVAALRVEGPGRTGRAIPTGLAIDREGNLTVADAANHAIYFYSTRGGFSRYRVLGYPGRSGSRPGRLKGPVALAQHARDGGGLSGNLFIADTGNLRVQRWDSGGGYTFWAREAARPGSIRR